MTDFAGPGESLHKQLHKALVMLFCWGKKKIFGSLHLSEKLKKKKKAMKDLGSRRSFSFIMWKIIFSSTTYNQNRRD